MMTRFRHAINRTLIVLVTLLCTAFGVLVGDQPNSGSSGHRPIYITHVTVIDTVTGREAREQTVAITDDRISKVGESNSIKSPLGANLVDGRGKYLIPGLWDMHVHAVFAQRLDSMLPMFVANGVLGIRDMGTSMPLAEIEQLRKGTRSGARLGPLIVAAGPILDGRPKPFRSNFLAITAPADGRDAVDKLSAGGADLIKVYSWLSRDTFLAIAAEANRQKIPFGGHVPFSVSALEASDAGQKSMEHLYGVVLSCSSREDELRTEMLKSGVNLPGSERIRLEMDEATASYDRRKATKVFEHLAKNRTWQVPTLDVVAPYAYSFDARVTTDPRLKYIPASVQTTLERGSQILNRRCDKGQNLRAAVSNRRRYAKSRCPYAGRDRCSVVPTVYLCRILAARRTRSAGSRRPNPGGSTAERNNQLRAFPRNGKRLGDNRERKDRESGAA